jgi:hypothetical protein
MKTPTLVQNRLYFGVDAVRLRESSDRVLARVIGVPPQRATVPLSAIAEDFKLSPAAGRALAAELCERGLLERLSPSGSEYGITDEFRALAHARVVPPLLRSDAQALVGNCARTARDFNRTAVANKYEIEALAVHGAYMSLDADLPDVEVGITGRRRHAPERPAAGRGTQQTEGTTEIRARFEALSPYLRVTFFKDLSDMPRPFSVVFREEG